MRMFEPMTERTPPILPVLPARTEPEEALEEAAETPAEPKKPRLDPTRYGDWELNGKCIDF